MKFVNNTKNDSKIKLMDRREKLGFRWMTAKVGAEVELPKEVGERERFTPVQGKGLIASVAEKLKGNKKKTDDKDKASSAYRAKLVAIDGIGARIVEDVVNSYPTGEILAEAIASKEHLPFRNDISDKLCDVFGVPEPASEPDDGKKGKDDE